MHVGKSVKLWTDRFLSVLSPTEGGSRWTAHRFRPPGSLLPGRQVLQTPSDAEETLRRPAYPAAQAHSVRMWEVIGSDRGWRNGGSGWSCKLDGKSLCSDVTDCSYVGSTVISVSHLNLHVTTCSHSFEVVVQFFALKMLFGWWVSNVVTECRKPTSGKLENIVRIK